MLIMYATGLLVTAWRSRRVNGEQSTVNGIIKLRLVSDVRQFTVHRLPLTVHAFLLGVCLSGSRLVAQSSAYRR
jgi:hypothetical protein